MRTTPDPRIPDPRVRRGSPGLALGTRGTSERCRGERYYVGRRRNGAEVYVVSRTAVEPLEHPGYRCAAPFDWGSPSRGALELAHAMLAHCTASRPPDAICTTFWTEVVACLDRSGFVLGDGEIALWLLTASDAGELPRASNRGLRARLWRLSRWGRGR